MHGLRPASASSEHCSHTRIDGVCRAGGIESGRLLQPDREPDKIVMNVLLENVKYGSTAKHIHGEFKA